MKRSTALLTLLLAMPLSASAAPFDMSSERKDDAVTIEEQVRPAVEAQEKAEPAVPTNRRYIIPSEKLMLSGEMASRNWTIYLTPGEAAAASKLNFSYRNAIFVAPETSRLSIFVNDRPVAEQPIQSPNGFAERSIELPPGLLQPGFNRISFRATQQHRTDCTIESTYQLWTEILPEETYLTIGTAQASQARSVLDTVRAVGVDKAGRTHFRIVVPQLQEQNDVNAVMQLSQALALLGGMPNQVFSVEDELGPADGPGELTVVVGTAGRLIGILPALPQEAAMGAFAGFVDAPGRGGRAIVLSGPDWAAVRAAIDRVAASLDRPETVQRDTLATAAWSGTDTQFLRAGTRLSFAKLGVHSTEFSGRRFRTGFHIGLPADLYADAYGEAQILLDAAYTDEILPGSHVDIYVNGNIATTTPITSTSGGLLRHLPIRLTMRHFRPGVNRIEIEAILKARADLACQPGASTSTEPRFALFDTSELRMPDFARIAEMPNLAATSGTGFPYGRSRNPISLFLDRIDPQTLSASATFFGKLALAAGRPLAITSQNSTVHVGDRDTVFIGDISQIPEAVLTQMHIAPDARTSWGSSAADPMDSTDGDRKLEEWSERLRGSSWLGQIFAFENWLEDKFNLSFGSLQFLPREEEPTQPPASASFLIAQGLSPGGTSAWTLLAAPNSEELRDGMNFFAENDHWRALAGRLTMLGKNDATIETVAAARTRHVETQPLSLKNLRLIAANWLSTNILSYSAALAGLSLLLGIVTSVMLSAFGRQK